MNRALRWREIERRLDGVRTILDVGAATGAFSIPLARRGYQVTHLDLAPAALEIARQKAHGLENMRFVEGNAADLAQFPERSFDLVLNMDGAISFCGSSAVQALQEACRVTGKTLIVTASHRARLAAVLIAASLEIYGSFTPAAAAMLETGAWHQEQFPENPALARGMTQDYMGALQAFTPGEVREILEQCGLHVLRCGGLGSLASLCGPETVGRVLQDDSLLRTFLDDCETFDRELLPCGPGTRQRSGLIAVAERIQPG
ncbi:MAG: class I SAM-dependent methyltransferase [Chloroflexota bacterium]